MKIISFLFVVILATSSSILSALNQVITEKELIYSMSTKTTVKVNNSHAALEKKSSTLSDTIYRNIDAFQADSLIKANASNPDFSIIDVRTPSEFEAGHIKGANNINFSSSDFDSLINNLDRNKIYLIYCQSGSRSTQAFNFMQSLHFRDLYNMTGGFGSWKANDLPYVTSQPTSVPYSTFSNRSINILPNPAHDKINVKFIQEPNEAYFSVCNINGSEILKGTINGTYSDIDISSLYPGIYVLKVSIGQSVFISKFIKK
jgi:rhodanese-related sulfurtransferase